MDVDHLGALRGQQPEQVRAAVVRDQADECGAASVRAHDPGDVDALAAGADLHLEGPHDGAGDQVGHELGPVDAEVRIRDQHLDPSREVIDVTMRPTEMR